MKFKLLATLCIALCQFSFAQQHPTFPQAKINSQLSNAFNKSSNSISAPQDKIRHDESPSTNVFSALNKMEELKNGLLRKVGDGNSVLAYDTVFVGDVPNDTLIITGNYTHTGPIFVFNDGVLIFYHATVIDTGDIYVFQNGQLFADSSSLTFPQQYFYERGLIAVQNAHVWIQNSSFNYSGMSHNLVLGDSALVVLNNIHQNDWTTCGLFGSPTLSMNGCNLGGEYILSGACNAVFNNVDTLILWHQFPETAVVNYSFPSGDTVYNYVFNNTVSGVSGLNYSVQADSCHTVMWAMMPVNGSDITISNSVIRAIGAWFQHGDTAIVRGLYDNSSYINFVAPVTDRNLHLINTDVQTWSLYAFDSSFIDIDSCQLGEVGTQQRSSVFSRDFLLDGTGGYFWATDTSFIFAQNITAYSTARSEKNGIFFLAYSWLPFSAPTAIGNSVMICVQNNLAQDPVPYDNAIAWMTSIIQPDTAHADSIIPVSGKAWIDQGPVGGWMFFGSYSLYYQVAGDTTWNVIVLDSLDEVHGGTLGLWNTHGLAAGNYLLKLRVKNSFADSVEAVKSITLLPASVGINENSASVFSATVFPNPSDGNFVIEIFSDKNQTVEIELQNALGGKISSQQTEVRRGRNIVTVAKEQLNSGIYFCRIISENNIVNEKVVVK